MDEQLTEISLPALFLPNFTAKRQKDLQQFWNEYEIHRDVVIAELLQIARKHQGFEFVLQNGSSILSETEQNTNVALQRNAILKGEWEPFLKELRREGVIYAQAGLTFQAWSEVLAAHRTMMRPYFFEKHITSPERLLSMLEGMDLFINTVIAVVGEGFFWAKEQLIRQQKEFLQENQGQLSGIIDSAMDAIIIIEEGQRILSFNPAAERMFGYSAGEVRGKPLSMLIPERLRQNHEADVRTFAKTSTTKRSMGRLGMVFGLRANGEEFPLEVSISQNEIIGGKTFTAILRDVTERKQAEEALLAREQLYHSTLDNMLEGVQIVDFDWRYRYVNDAVVIQGRKAREHLIGHRMYEVYPGIEKTELFSVLQKCMQERVSEKMVNEFSYPNGDTRWFELSVQPVPEGIFILSIDITDRKQAEEALRLENERLLRFTDSNIVGIVIADVSGKIILANDYFLNLLGVTRPDFEEGKVDWRKFTPPEWLSADENAIEELRERGVCEPYEKEYQRLDGSRVSVYIADAMLPGPEEQIVAFVLDITERKQAEQELRDSEEKLRLFIEHAPAALAMFDRDMHYMAASRRWLADYGLGQQKIVGRSHYDIFPEIPEKWKVVHQRGLSGEVLRAEKDKFVRIDESIQWLRWEVRPWHSAYGEIGGILIFSEDITERLAADEALRESEERFRKAIVEAPRPILIHDEDGRNLELSKGWTQFSGYTLEDIPTMDEWTEKAYGERSGFAKEYIDHLFEISETMHNGEWMINTKTGEQRVWDFYTTPIGLSREGKRILLSTAVDVTERKRAEDALRESEEKLRVAVKNSSFIPAQFDRELRYRWIYNPHPDFDPQQVLGKRDDELENSQGIQKLVELKRQVIESGEGKRKEISFERNNGTRAYDFTIEPLYNAKGELIGGTSAAFDVTDRKQAEEKVLKLNQELEERVKLRTAQLEAANKELEAFSYSVSHDLRAPLRSIDGFSLALLEDFSNEIPEEGKNYLGRIRSAAQRMAQLIDDMLNLSRVSRSPLERSKVDLSNLAAEVADELQRAEPTREVTFSIHPSLKAEGDSRLMKIVLMNLLGNAWKFTSKQEQARIEFGATTGEDGPVFFVRDNGSGFDMTYVNKLFGAFQRLHTTNEFPGTGIGLAIVQRIIHRHGGEIWAEGSPNQGATFYFTV